MGETPTLIPLGVVVAPHGVRGELKVRLYNPASTLLEARDEVWLREGTSVGRCVALEGARRDARGLLVMLSGTRTRDAADALRGAELCVPREELPEPEQGEVYLVDLVGLVARTPDGAEAGVVEGTLAYPSVTVLRVRSPEGVREVPCLDRYVIETRLAERAVIVDHLDEIELLQDKRAR